MAEEKAGKQLSEEAEAKIAEYESEEYNRAYVEREKAAAPPACFSDEEKAKLAELRALVDAEADAIAELGVRKIDLTDRRLAQFLVARSFKPRKALEAWMDTQRFRHERGLNVLLDNPPDEVAKLIRPYHPETHFGVDRFGRRLYYWRFGAINGAEISRRVSCEQYTEYHLWLMEHGDSLIEAAATERHGEECWERNVTIVVDAKGLSLGVRHFLNYFKPAAKLDELYYPETMGRIFVVNAPSVFGLVWRLIRPMLDPKTAGKVRVLGGDYTVELLEHIPRDQLLEEYGGTAKCPPEIDLDGLQLEALAAQEREAEADEGLTDELVPSRGSFETTVAAAAAGQEVEWFFRTVGHDIEFSAAFEPAGGGEPVVVVAPARVASHHHPVWGQFTAPSAGEVRLRFDNAYSWFTRKTLRYRASNVSDGGGGGGGGE